MPPRASRDRHVLSAALPYAAEMDLRLTVIVRRRDAGLLAGILAASGIPPRVAGIRALGEQNEGGGLHPGYAGVPRSASALPGSRPKAAGPLSAKTARSAKRPSPPFALVDAALRTGR